MSNGIHLGKGSQPPKIPDDGKLVLYSMRFCPFAQRAHLVLDAKNIPYHTVYIDLTTKPEWFPTKSPLGKVPALEIPKAGDPLIESLIICDYLDAKYPEKQLHPKDPLQKSRDRILVERFNGVISPYYKLCFSDKPAEPGVLTEFVTALDIFEEELKKRGTKFFGGSHPKMVDYMIWPWCERTDMMPFILGDKYELDKERFGKLLQWKELMRVDSAVKAQWISGENHFKFRESRCKGHPNYNMLAANPAKKLRAT